MVCHPMRYCLVQPPDWFVISIYAIEAPIWCTNWLCDCFISRINPYPFASVFFHSRSWVRHRIAQVGPWWLGPDKDVFEETHPWTQIWWSSPGSPNKCHISQGGPGRTREHIPPTARKSLYLRKRPRGPNDSVYPFHYNHCSGTRGSHQTKRLFFLTQFWYNSSNTCYHFYILLWTDNSRYYVQDPVLGWSSKTHDPCMYASLIPIGVTTVIPGEQWVGTLGVQTWKRPK